MAALVDAPRTDAAAAAPSRVDRRFEQLAESIAYQQLAGQAAATIWGRFRALFGPGPLDAAEVLAAPVEDLRAAGLSGAKAAAIVDLARHVADGTLALERAGRLPDAEVIGAAGPGPGHRPLDGRHVPAVHAAAPRRLAHR